MNNKNSNHFNNISDKFYNARLHINHITFKNLMWEFFFKDKDYLKSSRQTNVLEPMCGYADGKVLLSNFFKSNLVYEGFDFSEAQIEKARKLHPDLNIYQQNILEFSSDKEYDIVLIIGGLMYIPNKAADAVKNLKSSIRPGGYFINYEPTHNNFFFKLIRNHIYKKNNLFDEANERDFSLSEYNNMFKSSGYKLIDQIYPGLLSFVLYFNPDAFPFLNIGNPSFVKFIFNIDKIFFRNYIGKIFSFATISLWQKSEN